MGAAYLLLLVHGNREVELCTKEGVLDRVTGAADLRGRIHFAWEE